MAALTLVPHKAPVVEEAAIVFHPEELSFECRRRMMIDLFVCLEVTETKKKAEADLTDEEVAMVNHWLGRYQVPTLRSTLTNGQLHWVNRFDARVEAGEDLTVDSIEALQLKVVGGYEWPRVILLAPGIDGRPLTEALIQQDVDAYCYPKGQYPDNELAFADELEHMGRLGRIGCTYIGRIEGRVINFLRDQNVRYDLVYPSLDQRDVYKKRFIAAKAPPAVVAELYRTWNQRLHSYMQDLNAEHHILRKSETTASHYFPDYEIKQDKSMQNTHGGILNAPAGGGQNTGRMPDWMKLAQRASYPPTIRVK